VIPARSSSFSLPCHRLRRIPLVSLHLLAIVLAFDISCPSWSPAFIFVLGLRHPRVRPSLRQLYSISSSIIITATLLPLPSPSLSSPSPLRGHTRRRVRQSTSVDIHPCRPASLDPLSTRGSSETIPKRCARSIQDRAAAGHSIDSSMRGQPHIAGSPFGRSSGGSRKWLHTDDTVGAARGARRFRGQTSWSRSFSFYSSIF
jgi:hypothetical protein